VRANRRRTGHWHAIARSASDAVIPVGRDGAAGTITPPGHISLRQSGAHLLSRYGVLLLRSLGMSKDHQPQTPHAATAQSSHTIGTGESRQRKRCLAAIHQGHRVQAWSGSRSATGRHPAASPVFASQCRDPSQDGTTTPQKRIGQKQTDKRARAAIRTCQHDARHSNRRTHAKSGKPRARIRWQGPTFRHTGTGGLRRDKETPPR